MRRRSLADDPASMKGRPRGDGERRAGVAALGADRGASMKGRPRGDGEEMPRQTGPELHSASMKGRTRGDGEVIGLRLARRRNITPR